MKNRNHGSAGRWAEILTALFFAGLLAAPPAPGQESPGAETLARGEALYFEHGCYGCHGYSGQNGPGQRLVGSPRLSTPAVFIAYVREPARMPAYSEAVISDAELTDMHAYIRTLPAGPNLEDIPLLQELIEEQ